MPAENIAPKETTPIAGRGTSRRRFLTLLFLAAIVRLAFVFRVSAWQSPDEYPHFWYARAIGVTHALPAPAPDFPADEAFQPPLYYLMAAPLASLEPTDPPFFEKPGNRAGIPLLLVRLLSVPLGVLTVWLCYRFTRSIPRATEDDALTAAACIAFLPTFVGTTSSVNNDGLVVLLASLSLVTAMREQWNTKTPFLAGAWVGAAVLAKINGIVIAPALVLCAARAAGFKFRPALKHVFFGIIGALPGIILLIARNMAQAGTQLLLNPGRAIHPEVTVSAIAHALQTIAWSTWFAFGRIYNISLPPPVYVVVVIPLLIAAAMGLSQWRKGNEFFLMLLTAAIVATLLTSLAFTLSYPERTQTSWGKNLFPVLLPAAAGLSIGWRRIWPRLPLLAIGLLGLGCVVGLIMVR